MIEWGAVPIAIHGMATCLRADAPGDGIVMRSADLSVLWSTHVNGMVGHYNSILIEDYDGVAGPELYLGGSRGLWRFLVNLEPESMMRSCMTFFCSAVSLLAQQTWVVNNAPGAVADFTDLPQAVAAAAPGDTVFVVYTNNQLPKYSAPTIDKPLALMGVAQTASTTYGPTYAILEGMLSIQGIAAGEQVLVSNILVAPAAGVMRNGLGVQACSGGVVLEDVHLFAGSVNGTTWSNWTLQIQGSADVTVRGSAVNYWGTPLSVIDSTVLLATTRVEAAVATLSYFPGSAALHLVNSTVTLIDSLVSGRGLPNPGALLDQSTLRVGPSTTLEGPYLGGIGPGSYWLGYDVVGGAGAGSTIELDPRGVIRQIPNATGSQQPTPTRIDAVLLSWVTANRDFTTFVAGPAGGFALLMLGELIPPTPTPLGDLVMHPGTAFAIGFEPMDLPNDMHLWTLHCPPGAPVAIGFALQALTLSPNGEIALTVPAPFTVAWQPGTVP